MGDAMSDDEQEFTLAEVAARLHHGERWLQTLLAEDRRSCDPVLQYHYHIGRKPLWTERRFQMLKAALIERDRQKRANEHGDQPGLSSSKSTDIGIYMEQSVFEDSQSACADGEKADRG